MESSRLTTSTVIGRTTDAVSRVYDDRAVVISLDEGRIRTLNPSGTVLFHALAEQDLSVGDLVTVLANAHPEVDSATLERDVVAFAEDLVTRGLAVVRAP